MATKQMQTRSTRPWLPEPGVPLPRLADLDLFPGKPVESGRHRRQQMLLEETLARHWAGRDDVCVEGNFFFFFDPRRMKTKNVRGPDLVAATGVQRRERKAWATWEEGNLPPDVVIEVLSPSTARTDRQNKRSDYERVGVPELFHFDPWTAVVNGWRNSPGGFVPILPNAAGRYEAQSIGLELGRWHGEWLDLEITWLRWFAPGGLLLPTDAEVAAAERARTEEERARAEAERARTEAERARAEAERARAEAERARAEEAERRVAQLEARLAALSRGE